MPSRLSPQWLSPQFHVKSFNNAVELINFPAILHNENVEVEAHKVSAKFVSRNIFYELTNSKGYKMFNVNNVVSNINLNSFIQNPDIEPCSCRDLRVIDKGHGHILTGDLRIVKNSKLRKVICKGEKSREFP